MFYLFDLCLGFCALIVCIAYAYISTLHSGPRLSHQLLGIRMVVVTYTVVSGMKLVGRYSTFLLPFHVLYALAFECVGEQ